MNRIKEVLKEQGRTQTWLADKIDKSYVIVTNYCNNNKRAPIEVLRTIASALDIDVWKLLNILTINGFIVTIIISGNLM